MSNKENLMVALENAENLNNEVEIGYASNDGIGFLVVVKPDIMTQDGIIRIYDTIRGVDCQFVVDLSKMEVNYDEVDEDFMVVSDNGIFTFHFR